MDKAKDPPNFPRNRADNSDANAAFFSGFLNSVADVRRSQTNSPPRQSKKGKLRVEEHNGAQYQQRSESGTPQSSV
jgi:hypothetical protein